MSKNIVIIGMPGSGKTTMGKLVAEKLNKTFIDMDDYMVDYEGKSIKEMFAISEDYFRDVESKCSVILGKLNSLVIASGGGVVKRKENINALKENSIIVFLNRPVENIIKDIDSSTRPLLADGKERLYVLYNERIQLYKSYCDIEILNDDTIETAVDEIIKNANM
ncbi:MAG: shikimate kinase [Bacillota bacterium]|nr:shikimate kinase [Bacillota bacterium]